MIDRTEITGVVLAGGKSMRTGTDKTLLAYAGSTFLQHAVDVLGRVFTRVMVIPDRREGYASVAVPIYPDIVAGSGPLVGSRSALSRAVTRNALVLSLDAPFMTPNATGEILRRAEPGEVATATDGADDHQLVGMCPTSLLPAFDRELRARRRQVRSSVAPSDLPHSFIRFPQRRPELRNINT